MVLWMVLWVTSGLYAPGWHAGSGSGRYDREQVVLACAAVPATAPGRASAAATSRPAAAAVPSLTLMQNLPETVRSHILGGKGRNGKPRAGEETEGSAGTAGVGPGKRG